MMLHEGVQAKWVEGFEDVYMIREDGILLKFLKTIDEPKVIGTPTAKGYIQCSLTLKGRPPLHATVHRLVAKAFVPNPDDFATVDHIDGNTNNNQASNLRWCSIQKNTEHYFNNRSESIFLRDSEKQLKQAKAALSEVVGVERQIHAIHKDIRTDLVSIGKDLDKKIQILNTKEQLLNITQGNYTGYKNIAGEKFESINDLVDSVGKQLRVNGEVFPSAGAAARYVGELIGKDPKHISRTIRKFLAGKLGTKCTLYNEYSITPV